MGQLTMTYKELEKAIRAISQELRAVPRPAGPLPDSEVKRRELILLKQVTLYKIWDAKK